MTDRQKNASDYVDAVLARRRPRRFRASQAETDVMRAASALAAATGERAVPDPAFLARLHRRLEGELEAPVARHAISRRRLLGLAAGAALAGGAAGAVVLALEPAAPAPRARLEVDRGTWIHAADVAAVPPGTATTFTTNAVEVLIVNLAGQFRAFSGACTHLGCRLQPASGAIACPCHRTTFGLDGHVLTHELPTAPPPLPELPVRVVGDRVEVFAV